MANTLTTLEGIIFAKGMLALREAAILPRYVNTDYAQEFAQKGATVDISIPASQTVSDVTPGATPPTPASKTPTKVQMSLDYWRKTDFHLTAREKTRIEADKHFIPGQVSEAMRALANDVNTKLGLLYKGVYGTCGATNAVPFASDAAVAINARKVLNQQLAPEGPQRAAIIDNDAAANALALANFVQYQNSQDGAVLREGELGRKYGFTWAETTTLPSHTAGTITTGLTIKSATAHDVGATSLTCRTAASTGACALKEGDVITIGGENYAVSADATQASAATDVTVTIADPGLRVALSGGEAITVTSSHQVNLAFHRDAFALAVRPLAVDDDMPPGTRVGVMVDPISGIPVRMAVMPQYNQTAYEFSILYGVKLIRPQYACRILGTP